MVTAFTQSSGPLRHVPHMSLASSEWFRTAYLKPAAEYQPLREALFAPVQAPIEQAIAPLQPTFASLPELASHWAHPLAMLIVVGLAVFGGWLGLDIRRNEAPASAVHHPTVMRVVLAALMGGQLSGLACLAGAGEPILKSPHALTGVIVTLGFAINAAISSRFSSDDGAESDTGVLAGSAGGAAAGARRAHARIGMVALALLVIAQVPFGAGLGVVLFGD